MDNRGFSGDSKDSGLDGTATHQRHLNGSLPRNTPNGATLEVVLDPTKLGPYSTDSQSLLDNDQTNGRNDVLVTRSVFNQKTFDEKYKSVKRPRPTLRSIVTKQVQKSLDCSCRCWKDFIFQLFPCINILRNYKIREDLTGDLVSGLTVGIMHIPQGMAYGMLTTLPPVYGLYTSFFPVLIYFLLGSSKHISMGTFAVASLMIGTVVSKGFASYESSHSELFANVTNGTGDGNSEKMSDLELKVRLQYAMSLTFMVGIIQLLMGLFQLGFVTVYLSDPLISGFTTGAACHVFTSQIKHVFGIKTDRYSGPLKLIYTYGDFFRNIPQTNSITLIASILCIALLYSVTRFINQNPKLKPKMFMPVPIELIVVVLGTLISYFAKLNSDHEVVIVGDIPKGLPEPASPFTFVGDVVVDAVALSIVLFAVSISMAKILAKKHDYEVSPNQELLAYGACNVFSSFFSAFSPSASLSRSLVQERVGGRTQVAGLVSCVLLLIVLLAIGPLFETLPNCILASIIINALKGMFLQVLDLKRLWRVSIIDFFVWVVSFMATVLMDVDYGLGVAVIFGILTVVIRSQKPYACMLGRISGTDIYRDINVYTEAREIEGVKIFRFEQSLFFVNTETFRTLLYEHTINPRHLKIVQKKRAAKQRKLEKKKKAKDEEVLTIELDVTIKESEPNGRALTTVSKCPADVDFHTIIFDCSSWSFVDSMGVKVLTSVIAEYNLVGVKIYIAACKAGLREMFDKTEFYSSVDRQNVFVTVHDAVLYCTNHAPVRKYSQLSVSEATEATHEKPFLLDDIQFVDDDNKHSTRHDDDNETEDV